MSGMTRRYYRRSRFPKMRQFAFRRAWDARQSRSDASRDFWLKVWLYLTDPHPDPDAWRRPTHF